MGDEIFLKDRYIKLRLFKFYRYDCKSDEISGVLSEVFSLINILINILSHICVYKLLLKKWDQRIEYSIEIEDELWRENSNS